MAHYCQAPSFASNMYCLVLLSVLLACAAGKCYSYSNVMLDGPDVHDIQGGSNITGTVTGLFTHKSVPVIFEPPCICIYELSNLEQSSENVYFLLQSKNSLPNLWKQTFITVFTKEFLLSPSSGTPLHLNFYHLNLKIRFNIIRPSNSISSS